MSSERNVNSVAEVSASERTRLLRLAYRFCWNVADAEDALQDALLEVARKESQLRDACKRWAWLCRVVIQHCHLRGRKQQRARAAVEQRPASGGPGDAGDDLSRKELGELMRRLLRDLPHQQRVAMTLRHIEQMDYPQIARVMELTESTVRVHVRAGREALRTLILKRHPEWKA